ncbi:hypothetical protein FEP83_04740 [Burkholderia multivorans]|nr:hypothetical protein [Burkholderia multivorans]
MRPAAAAADGSASSAAAPWRSQVGSGIVSSSVNAISAPRALRQPTLRAPAGPCVSGALR